MNHRLRVEQEKLYLRMNDSVELDALATLPLEIKSSVTGQIKTVLLELSAVRRISSSGLNGLVRILKSSLGKDVVMTVLDAPRCIRELIAISNLPIKYKD